MPTRQSADTHTFCLYRMTDPLEFINEVLARGYKEITLTADHPGLRLFVPSSVQETAPRWLGVLSEAVQYPAELSHLTNKTSSFVLLVRTKDNTYAACGGLGAFIVQKYADSDFGLEVASRILPPNRLNSIRSKHLAGRTAQDDVVYRGFYNLQLDPTLWGKVVKEIIGSLRKADVERYLGIDLGTKLAVQVSARSSFSVGRPLTLRQMKVLADSLDFVLSLEPSFTLLRGYEEVEPGDLRHELNELMLGALQQQFNDYTRSPEEFVETSVGLSYADPKELLQCERFKVTLGHHTHDLKELDLEQVFEVLTTFATASFRSSYLHTVRITGYDSDGNPRIEAPLSSFVYAEVYITDTAYLYMDKKWYRLRNEFRQRVAEQLQTILDTSTTSLAAFDLPCWAILKGKLVTEPVYISDACDPSNKRYLGLWQLHNKHVVFLGNDKTEVCDIFDTRVPHLRIIYVKRGLGGKLKELCAQARTSAELLCRDSTFMHKAADKLRRASTWCGSEQDFPAWQLVLSFTDHSLRRSSESLLERVSTVVRLDVLRTLEYLKELGYPGVFLYEIPHCTNGPD